jgi:voltage-gated potassium channel
MTTLRDRLYVVVFQSDTPAGRRFDKTLLLIILASLLVVIIDSVETVHSQYADLFAWIEWGFTFIFAVEYLLRLYCSPKPLRYAFSFYGLIDLLAIVPGILAIYYSDAQYLMIVRVVRMLRIFRVLKLSPISSRPITCWRPCAAASRKSSCSWSASRPWSPCSAP